MLDCKRDSDDRHSQRDREADVAQKDPHTREQKPQDVAQSSKEAEARVALDLLSERQQSDARHLEALHSERDADDGDAKNHPGQNVLEPDDEAPAENDPQDVKKNSNHYGVS